MTTAGLNSFQIAIANLFFSLPESQGFLLAGGGALIAQGIVPRVTEDLDLFTSRGRGDIQVASEALVAATSTRGWHAKVKRTGKEFRRLEITGPDVVIVDFAVDSPAACTPVVSIAGPSFAPEELVIRKTLALFSRAEPRDFVDVFVLHQQFDHMETLEKVAAADSGFTLEVFAQMLRSHTRLADVDFPEIGIPIEDIRAFFHQWAQGIQSTEL